CWTAFVDRIFWAIGPSPSSLIARGVAATTPIHPAAPHQNSHFVNSAKSESRMRISGGVRVSPKSDQVFDQAAALFRFLLHPRADPTAL
ncbi:MAG: hypothetical protein WB037_13170, partial [Pseudolabrys sp.]